MALNALNRSAGFIAVGGLLRAESEDELRNAAADAVKRGIKNIILDFRPLDHMNSAGYRKTQRYGETRWSNE